MRFLPAALVFGAAGASYIYNNDELAKTLSPASWVTDEGEAASVFSENSEVEQLASAPPEAIVAVAGPSELSLPDLFRFDLTPRTITDRWNRVSTGLGDVRYQGYRVPLVTGTTPSDLAGSLTYYFDAQPRLRRITFLGTTGDPGRVVEFFSKQFGFRRFQTGNPRVTSYRTHYRYTGLMEVTPAEVLDRHQAETNYKIDLSIER
jgi:hypothetical protein